MADLIIGSMKSFSLILVYAVLLLHSYVIAAQRTGDRGLILGFGASSFTGTDAVVERSKYIPGMAIGFFQEYSFGRHLALGSELTLSTKGSLLASVGDLNMHQVITYVEIPLLSTWIFMPEKRSRLFISAGPTLDIMLLAFNEVGFPEDIKRFDTGIVLAGGIRWSGLRFRFQVNQGLIDLDRGNPATGVRNRTFVFITGLSF